MACITGDDTGLVKVWNISKSTGATLSWAYGQQSRKRGVASMCWVDGTTAQAIISMNDGSVSLLDVDKKLMLSSKAVGETAVLAGSMSVVRDRVVMISKSRLSMFSFTDDHMQIEDTPSCAFSLEGSIDATHIHRKFGIAAVGGKDNDLCLYDLLGERSEPIFRAKNVRDHVLDIPFPVYVTGAAIVSPFVSCISTAYHQVRFYDRRSSERPVQEFAISREIERRPTTLIQWNCNKFLIGEASGDVHLYDTRRGFASRAKLRGGVGSVRQMTKHPQGHQILAVAGLDRKARLFHVPTGKQIMSMYTKQKATSVLLDRNLPMADDTSSYSGVVNQKVPEKTAALGDELWDSMDPVCDEFDEVQKESKDVPAKKARSKDDESVTTTEKKLSKKRRIG